MSIHTVLKSMTRIVKTSDSKKRRELLFSAGILKNIETKESNIKASLANEIQQVQSLSTKAWIKNPNIFTSQKSAVKSVELSSLSMSNSNFPLIHQVIRKHISSQGCMVQAVSLSSSKTSIKSKKDLKRNFALNNLNKGF